MKTIYMWILIILIVSGVLIIVLNVRQKGLGMKTEKKIDLIKLTGLNGKVCYVHPDKIIALQELQATDDNPKRTRVDTEKQIYLVTESAEAIHIKIKLPWKK